MNFTFNYYDSNELIWIRNKTNLSAFQEASKGKWSYYNQTWSLGLVPKSLKSSNYSVLIYQVFLTRNNINSVLMFILMPTMLITSFNIVCYLLPIGGINLNISLCTESTDFLI